ncbi:MAG: helix-turn-helix transcriptional regulator [Alistipes sp.]|nr:helix-turn-helix transcriptional regulator [Alistipes sp.]
MEELYYFLKLNYTSEQIENLLRPLLVKPLYIMKVFEHSFIQMNKLDQISKVIGLTVSGMSKFFMKYLGKSPYKYLMDRRNDTVYYDITTTRIPLKDLSQRYGFHSVQHFGFVIKKAFGVSPARLRHNCIAEN